MSSHSVEDIKQQSARLRGTLLASLANPVTGALNEDDQTLIKYHGSYQQDDRDIREERRLAKLEPAYAFMIRTRTPGGVVTPAQWLKLDAVATTYAERGLRITTRQAFQFHGVIKTELKPTMQAINAAWPTRVHLFASPGLLAFSLVFSTALGVIGGLYPAIWAMRMTPMDSIRRG